LNGEGKYDLTQNVKVRVVSDGSDPNVFLVRYGSRKMALAAMKE